MKHMVSDDCLHDADLYYKEALGVHECIDCGEYFKINELLSQSSEGALKDAALDRAIVAIRSLPEDALGYGYSATEVER